MLLTYSNEAGSDYYTHYFLGSHRGQPAVVEKQSKKITGLNKHSGKRYWRYVNLTQKIVSLTKTGRVYTVEHNYTNKKWFTDYWNRWSSHNYTLNELVKKHIGSPMVHTPMIYLYRVSTYNAIQTGVNFWLANSWREHSLQLFGQKRTSDYTIDLLSQARPGPVHLAHHYRGLVSDQMLFAGIEESLDHDHNNSSKCLLGGCALDKNLVLYHRSYLKAMQPALIEKTYIGLMSE